MRRGSQRVQRCRTPAAQGCIPPWKGRETGGRGAVREGFSKGARETVGILVDGIPRPYTGTQECVSYLLNCHSSRSCLFLWSHCGFPRWLKRIRLPIQETKVRSLIWKIPWRRKWQPTPVFLSGESHGQRSLAGYSPWGHKESDTAEQLSTQVTNTQNPGLIIVRITLF